MDSRYSYTASRSNTSWTKFNLPDPDRIYPWGIMDPYPVYLELRCSYKYDDGIWCYKYVVYYCNDIYYSGASVKIKFYYFKNGASVLVEKNLNDYDSGKETELFSGSFYSREDVSISICSFNIYYTWSSIEKMTGSFCPSEIKFPKSIFKYVFGNKTMECLYGKKYTADPLSNGTDKIETGNYYTVTFQPKNGGSDWDEYYKYKTTQAWLHVTWADGNLYLSPNKTFTVLGNLAEDHTFKRQDYYSDKVVSSDFSTLKKPSNDPTRTGYSFTGWYDGYTTSIDSYVGKSVTCNQTYSASWKAHTYTIKYKKSPTYDTSIEWNGADGTLTKTYGKGVTIPAGTKGTRDGYKFSGWKTRSKTYQPGDTITDDSLYSGNGSTGTLTSVWEPIKSYVNYYYYHNDSGKPTTKTDNFSKAWYFGSKEFDGVDHEYYYSDYKSSKHDAIPIQYSSSSDYVFAGWVDNVKTVYYDSNKGVYENEDLLKAALKEANGGELPTIYNNISISLKDEVYGTTHPSKGYYYGYWIKTGKYYCHEDGKMSKVRAMYYYTSDGWKLVDKIAYCVVRGSTSEGTEADWKWEV